MIIRTKDIMAINLKTTYRSSVMFSALATKKDKAGVEYTKLEPQVFDLAQAEQIVHPAPGKVREVFIEGRWHELFLMAPEDKNLKGKALIGAQLKEHVISIETPTYRVVDELVRAAKAPKKIKATTDAASLGLDLASEISAFAAAAGADTDEDEDGDETGADA
jgi:hypothetical protein